MQKVLHFVICDHGWLNPDFKVTIFFEGRVARFVSVSRVSCLV